MTGGASAQARPEGDVPPVSASGPVPVTAEPIVADSEFEAAVPPVPADDDAELASPLESIEEFERRIADQRAAAAGGEGGLPGQTGPAVSPPAAGSSGAETIAGAAVGDPELARPLPPIDTFQVAPVDFADAEAEADAVPVELAYTVMLNGLAEADAMTEADLAGQFDDSSALKRSKGRAANLAQLSSRVEEDTLLLRKLLAAQGWFDSNVVSRIDRSEAGNGQPLTAVFDVIPGRRFTFSSIAIDAAPTIPEDLVRSNLALRKGQPVLAGDVLGAEARVALALPENGYPFAEIGQRDMLLERETGDAAYTLPVEVGPRGSFGAIVSEGKEAFGADHVATLARFRPGQLYDSRLADDLRQALVATGLFNAVAVEPRRTGLPGPAGTEQVAVAVTQEAGPPRVIAATAGYGTGEGFRVEGSWTHRNLFPPEGALVVSGVAGTSEQNASVTFRRSNAGRRDRTFELAGALQHTDFDAYTAYTGRLAARISRDSTPLWHKRMTWALGAQVIGTSEDTFVGALGERRRRTYAIGGLSGQVGFDSTDDLLDPSRGFRITALAEPEVSINNGFSPYARLRLDGSAYFSVAGNIIVAGRARVASIQGVGLERLAPSRRLYAGGGGSVRGFAYQKLGPRDPADDPIGGRSVNEAAVELRYRFGDYGVVAFTDIGQSYRSSIPQFSDLRMGVGLGARLYTNFGPMRIDVATPLARKRGESRINVYVSIGQAF